jgi:hypothetical protein
MEIDVFRWQRALDLLGNEWMRPLFSGLWVPKFIADSPDLSGFRGHIPAVESVNHAEAGPALFRMLALIDKKYGSAALLSLADWIDKVYAEDGDRGTTRRWYRICRDIARSRPKVISDSLFDSLCALKSRLKIRADNLQSQRNPVAEVIKRSIPTDVDTEENSSVELPEVSNISRANFFVEEWVANESFQDESLLRELDRIGKEMEAQAGRRIGFPGMWRYELSQFLIKNGEPKPG